MKKKSIEPRLALYRGVEVKDQYTKDYIEYLKTRQYAITRWKNSNYNKELVGAMEQNNVKDITDFGIDEINQEKVSVNYKRV